MHIQKIKDIILGLKNILNTEMNLLDESGYILYSTDMIRVGDYDYNVQSFHLVNGLMIERDNYIYFGFIANNQTKYLLSIKGITKETKKFAKIIEIFFDKEEEKDSKEDFLRSLLLTPSENMQINDLCEKYHVYSNGPVQIIVIEIIEGLLDKIEEIVTALVPNRILVKINDKYFAVVKEMQGAVEETDNFPALLYDTILSELLYEVKIGVGTIVNDIKDWHLSYKTAESLVVIGKTFLPNKKIYNLKSLTIPLIISKLQFRDLEEFMKQFNCNVEEIFLNNELMTTIFVFFRNNLNISDTAKDLFIHRNTLIYRLNKIYDITGYDLRVFEDAILFNVILNGSLYLRNNDRLL